jgi:Fungal trichothecene efflux pump (TRI12)
MQQRVLGSPITPEKHEPIHAEEAVTVSTTKEAFDDSERVPEARGRDSSELPKRYWYNFLFRGSFCVIGFGFMSGTGGYALIAPLLGDINADIGPSVNITWVALAYLLCQSVTFLIFGRLSDVFSRRWFFIIGSIIGLIGSILGTTAKAVNQMIGAKVFIGIATEFQISFGSWQSS